MPKIPRGVLYRTLCLKPFLIKGWLCSVSYYGNKMAQASKSINPFRNGCEIQIPAGLFPKLGLFF